MARTLCRLTVEMVCALAHTLFGMDFLRAYYDVEGRCEPKGVKAANKGVTFADDLSGLTKAEVRSLKTALARVAEELEGKKAARQSARREKADKKKESAAARIGKAFEKGQAGVRRYAKAAHVVTDAKGKVTKPSLALSNTLLLAADADIALWLTEAGIVTGLVNVFLMPSGAYDAVVHLTKTQLAGMGGPKKATTRLLEALGGESVAVLHKNKTTGAVDIHVANIEGTDAWDKPSGHYVAKPAREKAAA